MIFGTNLPIDVHPGLTWTSMEFAWFVVISIPTFEPRWQIFCSALK